MAACSNRRNHVTHCVPRSSSFLDLPDYLKRRGVLPGGERGGPSECRQGTKEAIICFAIVFWHTVPDRGDLNTTYRSDWASEAKLAPPPPPFITDPWVGVIDTVKASNVT
jgi:hypothetical protein